MEKDIVETRYQQEYRYKENYLNNLNLHIPEWSRKLLEIYTSPMKDKIKSEIKNAEK